jgi:hypothetical protein
LKITKSIKQVNKAKIVKEIANIGCNKCPNCGTPLKHPTLFCKQWVDLIKGFMQIDCYKCEKCKCEWESEPYKTYD